jgi:hypothetical protein
LKITYLLVITITAGGLLVPEGIICPVDTLLLLSLPVDY